MTNPHTPAPRPWVLNGLTVEARNTVIVDAENGVTVMCEISNDDWEVAKSVYTRSKEKRKSAYDQLCAERYRALHPHLCMKHALEIGYEFKDDAIYTIFIKGAAMPKYVYGHEIKHEYTCAIELIKWFKPDVCDDAERNVNAWEGE